jgi:phosphoribosylformylglycinamidine cyclo-ligase
MNQYENLGVSSDKQDVEAATKNLDKGLLSNAFCKVFPDTFTNDANHCLISHADGVGTKTSLGYVCWKETGDLSIFENLAIDAIVMNLDDMLCNGALGPYTLVQNIGRNAFRIPGEILAAVTRGTQFFIEKMRNYGLDIAYCGGETADVNDIVRTISIDVVMQTRMERKKVIEANILPGNVIVGLASYGQSKYEDVYNSGIGSNGLTLARHGVLSRLYRQKYPESYEQLLKNKAYTGSRSVTEKVFRDMSVGSLILSPTRTYAPVIRQILNEYPANYINAMIHCSGGGQTKCLKFAKNVHIVKDIPFPHPYIFSLIQEETKELWRNMYKTFNMGSRYEIYCDQKVANGIIEISESFNVDAGIIGHVEPAEKKNLTIVGVDGPHVYE